MPKCSKLNCECEGKAILPKKKRYIGYVDFKSLGFASTLDDYKYRLWGIFKHKQDFAKTKVEIIVEEIL
jgi:hypothetical protein